MPILRGGNQISLSKIKKPPPPIIFSEQSLSLNKFHLCTINCKLDISLNHILFFSLDPTLFAFNIYLS